jgi:hypothetical protein
MEIPQEQKDAALHEALEAIQSAEDTLQQMIAHPGLLVRDDQVVTDPATDEPVRDLNQVRWAQKELAKWRKQRDKILGRDPVIVQRLVVPRGTSPEEIKRLAVQMAIRAAMERDTEDDEDDDEDSFDTTNRPLGPSAPHISRLFPPAPPLGHHGYQASAVDKRG